MARPRSVSPPQMGPQTPRAIPAWTAVVASVLVLAPRVAFACPVCFGENDSPLALGINYGILVMLGIIGGLWVAFGSFFIYLRRRARMVHEAVEGPAHAEHHAPHAQGGTI